MSEASWWWVLCGLLVAAEMFSGTFYLLMIALGLAAAALGAHAGLELVAQIVLAALVGGAATVLWHLKRLHQPCPQPATANPDVNLDVGATVQVDAWQPDGSAQVRYRGAQWAVQAAPGLAPELRLPGLWRVREVVGSRLIVEPA